MTEQAISLGFVLRNTCMCGGTLTKNYTKTVDGKNYELKIRPTRNAWALKLQNTIIAKGTSTNLIEKLNGVI